MQSLALKDGGYVVHVSAGEIQALLETLLPMLKMAMWEVTTFNDQELRQHAVVLDHFVRALGGESAMEPAIRNARMPAAQ